MGKLLKEIKQELTDLSDERYWARSLRKRYHAIIRTNPELADGYDVMEAQEILSVYLFPTEPSLHINWVIKTISFLTLIATAATLSIMLGGFLVHFIFPNASRNVHGALILGSIVIVGVPTAIAYSNNRENAHSCIVKRRTRKLRNWLAKTRI